MAWNCDKGYKPVNLDVTSIGMTFVPKLQQWFVEKEHSQQVLSDFRVKAMVMLRDKGQFTDPLEQPLMKLRAEAEEIKLEFTPAAYVNLVNISHCFSRLDAADASTRSKAFERRAIFSEAVLAEGVKKKGNTIRHWFTYVAVFSGSYVYFFDVEQAALIDEAMQYFGEEVFSDDDSRAAVRHR